MHSYLTGSYTSNKYLTCAKCRYARTSLAPSTEWSYLIQLAFVWYLGLKQYSFEQAAAAASLENPPH